MNVEAAAAAVAPLAEQMQKRFFQLIIAALLGIASTAALVYLFGFRGQGRGQSPTFVLYDDKHPHEALAVYADPTALKKHNVSAETFEAAFRAHLDAIGHAVAEAIAEMIAGASDRKEKPSNTVPDKWPSGITFDAYMEIVKETLVELWTLNPDGTHIVVERKKLFADSLKPPTPPAR